MSIRENLAAVRGIIAESAKISGRDSNEIKLIGVTKTIDAARIKELLAAGVQDIGELPLNKDIAFNNFYNFLQRGF